MRQTLRILLSLCLFVMMTQTNASELQHIEQELSDSVITTKITAKITKNKLLNPLKISVSTLDRVVTLQGHVNDKQSFVELLRLAVNTRGVKSVDTSHLDMKPVNMALTDAYITAKVEAAVLEAKVLDDESIPLVGINAKTINGIVTLSGDVKHSTSVAAILKRVNAIRGVKKIISTLHVTTV